MHYTEYIIITKKYSEILTKIKFSWSLLHVLTRLIYRT